MNARLLNGCALLLCLAAASGCGRPAAPAEAAAAPAAGTASQPIEVTAVPVIEREQPVIIQAVGSFAADEVSDVAPETSGLVAETPVDVGDRVARGAVIARLRTEDAALRLEQARAGLLQAEAALAQARERHELARATAARYEALVKTGDVSRTLADQNRSDSELTRQGVANAEAAVADARSRVRLAEKALEDTTIRAPFDGFITERPVAVGEYVTTSSRIATVMKLDPIRLRLQVPELEAGAVRIGQAVEATVEGLGGLRLRGRITAINPALDPSTRATIVETSLPNPDGRVRAGMFATAQIELGEQERTLFVPREAVLADPNTSSFRVFSIEDGTARLRIVQPGPERDGLVRVLSGLAPNERVATTGLDQLFDGAAVRAEGQ